MEFLNEWKNGMEFSCADGLRPITNKLFHSREPLINLIVSFILQIHSTIQINSLPLNERLFVEESERINKERVGEWGQLVSLLACCRAAAAAHNQPKRQLTWPPAQTPLGAPTPLLSLLFFRGPTQQEKREESRLRENELKEKEEVWFVFWLVFSLCGALGGARPINPQREETTPNQQTLRSKTTTPFLCWLSMPSRKERNCFVFCFGLPRSFWLLGAGSTHKPNQSAPFLLHWIISFHFIIQNKEESKLKLIGLFAPLFLSASLVDFLGRLSLFLASCLWRSALITNPKKEPNAQAINK